MKRFLFKSADGVDIYEGNAISILLVNKTTGSSYIIEKRAKSFYSATSFGEEIEAFFFKSRRNIDLYLQEIDKYRDIVVGSKLFFATDKRPFRVKARSGRYVIATKPFNARKTVLYTILDLQKGIRGRNNLVFNIYDYAKQEDIETCLKDLVSGETEVSHRHSIPLEILKVVNE